MPSRTDVLTFTDVPTSEPVDALWYRSIVRKREHRQALLRPWTTVDPEQLHTLAATQLFIRNVPAELGVLDELELCITSSIPSTLLAKIADQTWTAEQVLKAFIKRGVLAHDLVNTFSEILFEEGLDQARRLDDLLARTGKVAGPLHGLPLSIKDIFDVANVDSAMGWAALLNQPKKATTSLVYELQRAGAVIFCKTTVPQTLMSGECVSFIYGVTSTPFNSKLSAGGSSGGEAALISLQGSPLGIGTDIAGSVRTPANFCGIYGLCPTVGRFPYPEKSGMDAIRAVHGPMSRSIDGLEVYTKALLHMKPWEWDHNTIPMPWREEEYDQGRAAARPLVFGIMRHDGVVRPHPPIEKSMSMLENRLRDAGHHIIEFTPVKTAAMTEVLFRLLGSNGGKDVWEMQKILEEPLIGEIIPPSPSDALTLDEYSAANLQKRQLRQEFNEAWFATASTSPSGSPMDALILPSGGHVACPHGTMSYFTYEALSNVLDLPCASIPIDIVRPEEDYSGCSNFVPMSKEDQENWDKYDVNAYSNAPISVQVMGLRYGEERLLGHLRTIDRALGRSHDFQF